MVFTFAVDQAGGATLTVTNTNDDGDGSLRAAVAGAALSDIIEFSLPPHSVITLTSAGLDVFGIRIKGPGANLLTIQRSAAAANFAVFVTDNTTSISGLTIANGRADPDSPGGGGILNIGYLTLNNCVITGNTAGDGGGIYNQGVLTVKNCTITKNSADSTGGGILNSNNQLTVIDSIISTNSAPVGAGIENKAAAMITGTTISGNTAALYGGGLFNSTDPGAMSTITKSTISGNSTTSFAGGGIYNDEGGTVTCIDTTISDNTAKTDGGGVACAVGGVTISSSTIAVNTATTGHGGGVNGAFECTDSIIAGNNATMFPDVEGTVTSHGYNLIGNGVGASITAQTGDQLGTANSPINPMLGPLQDNGGATQTRALLTGSPAIERGKADQSSTTDQRGLARTVDDPTLTNATDGDGSDIGAFEVQAGDLSGCKAINHIVNSKADSGAGSLRDVMANVCTGDTITFAPNIRGAITLTTAALFTNRPLTINGPGADLLAVERSTVDGTPMFRILEVFGATVTVRDLTIRKGVNDDGGGGIYSQVKATLTLDRCVVSDNTDALGAGILSSDSILTLLDTSITGNTAIGNGGNGFSGGAGIYAQGGEVTLVDSTISGNSANNTDGDNNGGGIYNFAAAVTLINSTVSGNSAPAFGGGIYNYAAQGGEASVTVTNCTLSGNSALHGGGIYNGFAGNNGNIVTLEIGNSLLNAGTSGENLYLGAARSISDGHNLSSDDAGGGAGAGPGGYLDNIGDLRNTDPKLGQLADNGGFTATHALLSGSAAINAGDDASAPLRDQRGYARNGNSDIGSFEFNGIPLRVVSFQRVGPDVVVTVNATADETYRLERRVNLTDVQWEKVGDVTASATGPQQLTDFDGAILPRAFYRVRVRP